MDNKFEKSFYHVNNKLSEKPSVKDWAVAYVLTFGNNLENSDLLFRLAKRHGTFVTKISLKTSIESEINKQSHIRKVQKIKESMKSDKKREMITLEQIDAMSGYDFEHFLSDLFSSLGYNCSVTKASGDQGADVILEKFGERTVVQAKRYKVSVSNSAIQEVVAAKAHYECGYAMVVTSGYFTRSAIELANSNKVKLYDRAALKELINQY